MRLWFTAAFIGLFSTLGFAQPLTQEVPRASATQLTNSKLDQFFDALVQVEKVIPEDGDSADPTEPAEFDVATQIAQFSATVAATPHEQRVAIEEHARSHGFDSADAWARVGDRLLAVALWRACRGTSQPVSEAATRILEQLAPLKIEASELDIVNSNQRGAEFIADVTCPS